MPGQVPVVGVDSCPVSVTDAGPSAAVLVVLEEVAVATPHDQLRCRSPVACERVAPLARAPLGTLLRG